ncbi:MAG TPA: sigma-70 family RNA polymerase sigma factor [Stellaceae bacterium]|jgi:RNA polymerase sigma-70 factor (ECF subfamily)|nr:sigma-70 family RNA polymerase sigma factor [Stellaceae bacterium]
MDACAFVSPASVVSSPSVDNTADFATELAALRPFLLKRAIHLTNKRELAEDLVQTTFARALQACAQFTPGTNLKGWVATILHHEFYSHHRRSWRSASWTDEMTATLSSPLGEQESALDLQQVACALNDLPDGQREALVAIGLLGFAYEEVATLFNCSTGTVKSRVSRARIGLMEAVQARRSLDRRLIPASPQVFAQWLADLEAIRITACAKLAGKLPIDAKLPPLRKIALKNAVVVSDLRVARVSAPPVAPPSFSAAAAA